MTNEFFLTVKNNHVEECGTPPQFQSGKGYLSYFENEHGEQWVFNYDRNSGVFVVYGGDLGWDSKQIGVAGLSDLILNQPERMWILACFGACRLQAEIAELIDSWQVQDDRLSHYFNKG